MPSRTSYTVDHDDEIVWRIKSTMKLFADRDCIEAGTGMYNVWNYTDGDNGIANDSYVSLTPAETKDADGFTKFSVTLDP